MIRVLVVDDHPVVRAAVIDLLESTGGVSVVGQAVDGLEAIERADQVKPDVVLMDVTMPNMSGIEATRRLTAERSGGSVLMFSAEARMCVVRAAREAGAIGFVTKGCRAREVLRAIYTASVGAVRLAGGDVARGTARAPAANEPLALRREVLVCSRSEVSPAAEAKLAGVLFRLMLDHRLPSERRRGTPVMTCPATSQWSG